MTDRRTVLKAGGAGAAGAAVALLLREPSMAGGVPSALASTPPASATPTATPTVVRFVDPLPSLLDTALTASPAANAAYPGADYYEITMQPGQWRFHSQFSGAADTWGYFAGSKGIGYLGPTIVARRGRPVVVKYVNRLPATNRQFPVAGAIDPTIMGADLTPGRAMPHLHGGFTPPQFDGHPDGWWAAAAGGATSGQHGPRYATLPGAAANEAIFWYSNDQPATMLWYHDHARGITRLNVYVGLAGLYLIRDEQDSDLPDNG